jgi:hypothetical protein
VTDPSVQSQPLTSSTLELRRRLAVAFRRTADVLEHSAELADDDARRKARQGQPDLEAIEQARADRARRAARRARDSAERLTI